MEEELLSIKEVEERLKPIMATFRKSIAEIEQKCDTSIEILVQMKSSHNSFYKEKIHTYPFQLIVRKTTENLNNPNVLGYAANQLVLSECLKSKNNDI